MATLTMPKTQAEQLKVLVGVVGLLAAGLYWYLVYSPKTETLNTLQTTVEKLDAVNQSAKTEMARGSVSQLRQQALGYAENLVLMRRLVPASNEVPSLIDQVSQSARRVGLDVGAIEPMGAEAGTDFDAHKYRLRISGSYHAIAEFLANVGSLPRIVVPVNLALQTAPGGNRERTAATTFELHTYVARTATPNPGGGN
ncbi:MAG TPA: type 4a pilus biogenesis protein PilO [Gemmatimonadaceae bacterium]|nr:type 4a pilus biogenesis protein PilO [Gemmatimonadaceae bacterium]